MKRILSVIMFLAIIFSTLSDSLFTISATSTDRIHYEISGDYEYKLSDDGTAYIVYYLGSSETVEIPTILDDGYVVTGLSTNAFDFCESVISITIPYTVTYLAGKGFKYLSEVKVDENNTVYDSRENCNAIIETATNTLIAGCMDTVIPDSITSISEDAFHGCTKLTSITIPGSVTDIGESAFDFCRHLKSVEIQEGVKTISENAFSYCEELTSITIPISVTSIGNSAFSCCKSLTSVTIMDGVTDIGKGTFQICSSLKSLAIPRSVNNIGEYAFDSDIKLYVYENSYAHKYAEDNKFDYEVIASDNEKQSDNCSIDEAGNENSDVPTFDTKKILLCVSIPTILLIAIICVLVLKKKKT